MGPEGTQGLELKAVCPAANCERLNVVVGGCRVAVALDRPGRGAWCEFNVAVPMALELRVGDKVGLEFFCPGEQAGARLASAERVGLLNTLRRAAGQGAPWQAGR